MITNILSNKKLNSVVTELFIRGSKIKISLLFIMQSIFEVPKIVRLNTKHYFIIKAQKKKKKKKKKRKFQQIAYCKFLQIMTLKILCIFT